MRDVLALSPVGADEITPEPAIGGAGGAGAGRNSVGTTESPDALSAVPVAGDPTTPDEGHQIYASSSSDFDIEKQRNSRASSSDVIHDHVDIQYAERQFADLKRRYSNLSRVASTGSRAVKSLHDRTQEQEIGEDESDDEFDLEDVLRDRHRREKEHDIKPKHLGVVFENVTVRGYGGAKYFIRTFPDAFVSFFNVWGTFKTIFGKKTGTEFDILSDFTGCVRPGEVTFVVEILAKSEMLLVLGAPGSGCTSFLRTMANQRKGYTSIDGNVEYGGIDAKTFAKLYRGEAVYNAEGFLSSSSTRSNHRRHPFPHIDCGSNPRLCPRHQSPQKTSPGRIQISVQKRRHQHPPENVQHRTHKEHPPRRLCPCPRCFRRRTKTCLHRRNDDLTWINLLLGQHNKRPRFQYRIRLCQESACLDRSV